MTGCTIVARNYLAQARVLLRSFRRVQPQSRFTILVVDALGGPREQVDGADILHLDEIGLPPGEEHRMPLIYDVTELSTAVKPWLLRRLIDATQEPVLYFDPDIEIFRSVDWIADLARQHTIVLTPHVTEPIPRDGRRLNESDILGSGIYNLGFIGLAPGCEPFLDFWSERLRRECVIDPAAMRFTDQRWVDFAPGLYPHFILRDRTCNVAYWNLFSRNVERVDGQWLVNGEPLTFFHFSGYDPDVPHLLSKHQGENPRILLSEHPGVAAICGDYAAKLAAEKFNEHKREPYGFHSLGNGVVLTRFVRRLYREELDAHENGNAPAPPDPFAPGGEEAFLQWLNEPLSPEPFSVTRFMLALHTARPDLQRHFPAPLDQDAERFRRWFEITGAIEMRVPQILTRAGAKPLRNGTKSSDSPAPAAPAVNVVGYLAAELGVGEAGRRLITALKTAGIPCNAVVNRETLNRQAHPVSGAEPAAEADINILCINADQTPGFVEKTDPAFFHDRYCIGVWFWEVEEFPASMWRAFDYVDEVWVSTQFMRSTLLKVSPKPVTHVPLPILVPEIDRSLTRRDLELPEEFLFLYSFDFMSVFERKNPLGLIEAFTRAFPAGSGAALVIKTINGDKKIAELEKLRYTAAAHPHIRVIDGYLSATEKNTLTALCDCYISLHRAEGYGLTIAEAMALEKPVIATAYSGNMDFTTAENTFLCPFELQPIGTGSEPYPPAARWAEPNLDAAAALMRQVFDDRAEARRRAARAAKDVRELHSPAAAALLLRARIEQIRQQRAHGLALN
jgi:glycosyltransferase involved in cell wall biosynthesis